MLPDSTPAGPHHSPHPHLPRASPFVPGPTCPTPPPPHSTPTPGTQAPGVRPPTEPFNHPECKASHRKGKQDVQLRSDVRDGQMGIQIKIRITRQTCPWQTSCSLASGLQDSQICVYLKNGRAYKTLGGGEGGCRFCSSGQRPHAFEDHRPAFPRPSPSSGIADGFQGNWGKECGSPLERVIL